MHPAKAEVRFRDRTEVETSVHDAVRKGLAGLESTRPIGAAPPADSRRSSSSRQHSRIRVTDAAGRSGKSPGRASGRAWPTRLIQSAAEGSSRSSPSSPKARRHPVRAAVTQKRSVATRVPSRSKITTSKGKAKARA